MKTFSLKAGDMHPKWYVIDAKDLVVGRVSAVVAKILRGKNEAILTPHMNHGGRVVVINAREVHFTGGKDKPLYRHTGYPGGIKHSLPSEILAGPHPERVMRKSVERMLGKAGPLRRERMKNLYVYSGQEHLHEAQKPVMLDVGSWNVKNRKKES
jgi:large subunit ribosomal protein L13